MVVVVDVVGAERRSGDGTVDAVLRLGTGVVGNVFLRVDVAKADVAAPAVTREVGLKVGGGVLLVDLVDVLPVEAFDRIAVGELRIESRQRTRAVVPDRTRRGQAQVAVEAARVVRSRGRVVSNVGPVAGRALADIALVFARMVGIADAEIQRIEEHR